MITDERKAAVDSLSDEELEWEVEKGRASRFQGGLHDYARVQLASRKEARQAENDKATLAVAREAVVAANQAKNATHIGWLVVLVLGVAGLVAQCLGKI